MISEHEYGAPADRCHTCNERHNRRDDFCSADCSEIYSDHVNLWSAIPEWVNYIAQTEDKQFLGFTTEPYLSEGESFGDCWRQSSSYVCTIPNQYAPDVIPDWKKSLVSRYETQTNH